MAKSDRTHLRCEYFQSRRCRSCSLLAEQAPQPPLPSLDENVCAFAQKIGDWQRAPSPFYSRAKAKMSVSGPTESPCLGILDADLRGVELLDCPLHLPLLNACLHQLKELLPKYRIPPYQIAERSGELKGLILQCNQAQSHCIVRFVLRSADTKNALLALSKELQSRLSVELSTSLNIQAIPHQILEGPEEELLLGPELLWEIYNDVNVAFPPNSFMQVTPAVASQLYAAATEAFRSRRLSTALDLYCGAGGFSLHLGRCAELVYGVELRESAVQAARQAAKRNGLSHVRFEAAGVDDSLDLLRTHRFDAVVCNPPRRGLSPAITELLCERTPQLLLYSSCNPTTLRRDLELLSQQFSLAEITPFEMFPLTTHYEVLAVLEPR